MQRTVAVETESYPIAGIFRIARGAKTEAEIVICTVSQDGAFGRGECVPYARYGETLQSVVGQIEGILGDIAAGIDRPALMRRMPAGAARNALDCALWDLEAKTLGRSVAAAICSSPAQPLVTAETISLGTPEEMAARAAALKARPLLKMKVGGQNDAERMRAVADAAPASRLIVDANEGWTDDNVEENLRAAAECGVSLVEQPLPAGRDSILRRISRPVPVCADESVHTADDLPALKDLYDAVNIKLDKAGGLTAAIELRDRARDLGFMIMVGCMVGTSLAMAPAVLLAQDADFIDLDGPLLLTRDRSPALTYDGALVHPPQAELWG